MIIYTASIDWHYRILANADWATGEDGWVLGDAGELLLWIPPWVRAGLMTPMVKFIIGADVFEVDLHDFRHGTAWQDCWDAR